MSSFDIDWCGNFYGIYWAYEEGRLVVSTVFEDKEEALQLAEEVETWSDKFTRMTIIEKNNDEYAICCYQDLGDRNPKLVRCEVMCTFGKASANKKKQEQANRKSDTY